jgi:beta-N-acetylhexosaminidase
MDDLHRRIGSILICGFEGTVLPDDFRTLLQSNSLAGVILFARNYQNLAQLRQLTSDIQSLSPLPVLIAVDQEGGRVVRFSGDFPTYPSPRYYGLNHDLSGLLGANVKTADRLVGAGINVNLLPVCDLAPVDPAHVIHSRSYSDNPQELAESVAQQIRSLREHGLLSCAKHFPGLASAYGDPHHTVSRSDQSAETFRLRDYLPFCSAIAAGVDMVMTTHLLAPRIDPDSIATFSNVFVDQELRRFLGFTGLVITDDLLMAGSLTGIAPAQAGVKALQAGSDLLLYGCLSGSIVSVMDEIAQCVRADSVLTRRLMESSERVDQFRLDRLK